MIDWQIPLGEAESGSASAAEAGCAVLSLSMTSRSMGSAWCKYTPASVADDQVHAATLALAVSRANVSAIG